MDEIDMEISDDLDELYAVRLELSLTMAFLAADGDKKCLNYFEDRAPLVIPRIIQRARELEADPAEVFHTYAQAVHAKLCGGKEVTDDAKV